MENEPRVVKLFFKYNLRFFFQYNLPEHLCTSYIYRTIIVSREKNNLKISSQNAPRQLTSFNFDL